MTCFFRILIGGTAMLAGAWSAVVFMAGTHGNLSWHDLGQVLFLTASALLFLGGLLVLTKGWPFRKAH